MPAKPWNDLGPATRWSFRRSDVNRLFWTSLACDVRMAVVDSRGDLFIVVCLVVARLFPPILEGHASRPAESIVEDMVRSVIDAPGDQCACALDGPGGKLRTPVRPPGDRSGCLPFRFASGAFSTHHTSDRMHRPPMLAGTPDSPLDDGPQGARPRSLGRPHRGRRDQPADPLLSGRLAIGGSPDPLRARPLPPTTLIAGVLPTSRSRHSSTDERSCQPPY
jgi:hypothetical protein